MSGDGQCFNFDPNANNYPGQENRHSPPALDNGQGQLPGYLKERPSKLFIPQEGNSDHERYKEIWSNLRQTDTISNLSYHMRKNVKEALNETMDSGDDWRGVASRMGVRRKTIEKIEAEYKQDPTSDPTDKIFSEMANKKITDLVQVLFQMDRHDVLNFFYNDISSTKSEKRRNEYKSSKFPSQESTPDSAHSSASSYMSSPIQFKKDQTPDSAETRSDSGLGSVRSQPASRKKSATFAQQNSDVDLAKRLETTLTFHSTESSTFWRKIPPRPDSTRKEWKEMEKALKEDFRKESSQSQVMRFICYVLKIEPYEERHNKFVHDRDFANLVAWFGPVKSGKDGLFWKITQLIKGSTTYKENMGPQSFFAGYMSKDEADQLIGNTEIGTFLIRFSSTHAEQGSFVVCLKTETGTEHVLLEGNPLTGKLSFNDKDYDDLVTLYRRELCKGGVSQNGRISCTTICLNLPLNAMLKPYGTAPKQPQSCGRGRGRGRGAEQ